MATAAAPDAGVTHALSLTESCVHAVGVRNDLNGLFGPVLSFLAREETERWGRGVAALDFDTLCCAHMTPIIPNGRQAFMRCVGVKEAELQA